MKTVSIQELKAKLSSLVAEAARGTTVVITRHRRPVACLTPADQQHLSVGRSFGQGALKPLLRQATRGRYLRILAEDRRGDPDGR